MLAEPKPLLDLARRGEEVLLTDGGEPVVRLTAVPARKRTASPEALRKWRDEAAATGRTGMTSDEIVAELRAQKAPPTEAEMESRRQWLAEVARHAAAASTGKTGGSTTEEIIDDLRSERC